MKSISFLRHHFRSFIVFLLFIFALPAFGAKRDMGSYKKSKSFARSVGIQSARTWKIYVAAEKGDVESQYNLAHMYFTGTGVKQNIPAAFKWYARVVGQGHLEAQRILESHEEFAKYRIQLDSVLSRHINGLELSAHNKQAFQSKEIYFIGDLVGRTETELLKILNFSMQNLINVKDILAPLYLEPGMDIWLLYFEHKKKEWDPLLARHIDSLALSTRIKNTLKDEGIHYGGDLIRRTERLLQIYTLNFGRKGLDEVKDILGSLGLKLGMNIYWPSNREQEEKLVQYLNDKGLTSSIKTIDPILAHPIENLGLSTWTRSALKAVGVPYLGALVSRAKKDLLRDTILGEEGLSEIETVLASLGLELGMNIYWPSNLEEEKELVKRLGNILNRVVLTEREVRIMKMRFGIGESRRTLKEIGQVVNVSTERVRQIQVKALRQLTRFGKLMGRVKDMDYSWDLTSEQIEMLLRVWNPGVLVENNRISSRTEKRQAQDLSSVLARRVDSLELSTRSKNALQSEDIYYLYELLEKTDRELRRIPNLGTKSLIEIKTVLISLNWELGQQLDAETQYNLAVRYYEGDGVERNLTRAFDLYTRAARKGYVEAQYSLAYMYSKGDGVEKNLQEAIRLWTEAVGQGHPESQRSLDDRCSSAWKD